jgi:glycerophosphoryl diester phosphodiesterase
VRQFVVIAHRGASGYLPEHTLEGAALAHAQGADYIEQDAVLTRDGALVVLHDLYLDAVTDVAERFPGRQRDDGRHYAIDFTLEEIRRLSVGERLRDDAVARFPSRFPAGERLFRIPTLDEEIRLIRGLNRSTGRRAGLYVEPKAPAWHRAQGHDLMRAVIELLVRHGLGGRDDPVFLQSFDCDELRRAREGLGTDLKLVQLIGDNSWGESPSDFDLLRSAAGLRGVAEFAQGIGPWLPQVIDIPPGGRPQPTALVPLAHRLGLFAHAYTLRADELPPAVGSMAEAVRLLTEEVGLDGVFADQPDQVIRCLS